MFPSPKNLDSHLAEDAAAPCAVLCRRFCIRDFFRTALSSGSCENVPRPYSSLWEEDLGVNKGTGWSEGAGSGMLSPQEQRIFCLAHPSGGSLFLQGVLRGC